MKIEVNKKELVTSIIIFLFGLLLPFFIKYTNIDIYGSINKALELWDKEYLLIAMFKLVLLNSLNTFPIYLSMFILFDAIKIIHKNKVKYLEKIIFTILIIPITYKLISLMYSVNLLMGKTSILTIFWFYYYARFNFKSVNLLEKCSVFLIFIIGLHWLDMNTFFNFLGVGEITSDLNRVITFMDAKLIVSLLSTLFFLFFTSFSILILYFFKCQEEKIMRFQSETENRSLKETQQLVHDLKTPIFSIGALLELLKLQETDKRKIKYLDRIENSLNKTNIMIGEILDIKSKSSVYINDIMNFVLSFLSSHKNIDKVSYKNYAKDDFQINGNKGLLSRCIINLIVNSWEANSQYIDITIKEYSKTLLIKIEDYGEGILDKNISSLFNEGFSTKSSSGKGLHFVKQTINDTNGYIYFIPKESKGIIVYLVLNREELC
ncbi:MAG: sensor histidine kinase [Fusobacteriaceae bacterium]